MVEALEVRLGLDGMEEADQKFLSLVIPLALIPLGLVHKRHEFYISCQLG